MHFPPGLPNLAGTTQSAIQRACGPVMADYARDGILLRVVWSRTLARFDRRVVNFVARTKRDDLATVARIIVGGMVRVAIDRTYPLNKAAEAVRYVGTGQARGKVVVTVP